MVTYFGASRKRCDIIISLDSPLTSAALTAGDLSHTNEAEAATGLHWCRLKVTGAAQFPLSTSRFPGDACCRRRTNREGIVLKTSSSSPGYRSSVLTVTSRRGRGNISLAVKGGGRAIGKGTANHKIEGYARRSNAARGPGPRPASRRRRPLPPPPNGRRDGPRATLRRR